MDAQQRINIAKSSVYIDQIASLHTLDHRLYGLGTLVALGQAT